MNKHKQQSGFTLIEVLVVISIISLISSIVLTAVVHAREQGRDSKRLSDFGTMITAIQTYLYDKGTYPPQEDDTGGVLNPLWGVDDSCIGSFIPALVTDGFINKTAKDPLNSTGTGHCYYYLNNNGNVGGATTNPMLQDNIARLLCGPQGAKAVIEFYLEGGPSKVYQPAWNYPALNVYCFKE